MNLINSYVDSVVCKFSKVPAADRPPVNRQATPVGGRGPPVENRCLRQSCACDLSALYLISVFLNLGPSCHSRSKLKATSLILRIRKKIPQSVSGFGHTILVVGMVL